MPAVRRNRTAERELLARYRDSQPSRTDGVHMSDLVGCTRKAWLSANSGITLANDDEFTLIVMLGEGHHGLIGGRTDANKTQVINGISLTPDEIVSEEGLQVIIEYKTTRKSANKTIYDLGNYVDQIGGYCFSLNIKRARLHVFHLVGSYRPPTPVHKCYELEFEDWELKAWGDEIQRRHNLLRAAEKVEDISLYEHFDWECSYCPYKNNGCGGGGGERVPFFQAMSFEGEL